MVVDRKVALGFDSRFAPHHGQKLISRTLWTPSSPR